MSVVDDILRDDGAALPESGDAFNRDPYLARAVLRLRDRFDVRFAFETGTFHGVTTEWLSRHFERVKSVEINDSFLTIARARLAGGNVDLVLGDSALSLHAWMRELPTGETPLVFLDAHWGKNPLHEELAAIGDSGVRPILLIHDFKVPNHPDFGFDIYPEQEVVYDWEYVETHVCRIYGPGTSWCRFYNRQAMGAQRGCLFVVPIGETS